MAKNIGGYFEKSQILPKSELTPSMVRAGMAWVPSTKEIQAEKQNLLCSWIYWQKIHGSLHFPSWFSHLFHFIFLEICPIFLTNENSEVGGQVGLQNIPGKNYKKCEKVAKILPSGPTTEMEAHGQFVPVAGGVRLYKGGRMGGTMIHKQG